MKNLILIVTVTLLLASNSFGENDSTKATTEDMLTIAVAPIEPDVIKVIKKDEFGKEEISYEGFGIDLWKEIMLRTKLPFGFIETDMENRFKIVNEGIADASIAGSTITSERKNLVDFTFPYLDAYIGILVRGETENIPLFNVIKDKLLTKEVGYALLGIYGVAILGGIILYLSDYHAKNKSETHISDKFPIGIEHGIDLAFAGGTTMGFGNKTGTRIITKYIFLPFIFFMMASLLAIPTGAVFSAWTYRDQVILKSEINGPEDLQGKVVGTIANTTSVLALEKLGASVRTFKKSEEASALEEACKSLLAGEINAVVYDSPALLYYMRNEGRGKVALVGPTNFEAQKYGFALQLESKYIDQVENTLLEIIEDGTYDMIYKKWFVEN